MSTESSKGKELHEVRLAAERAARQQPSLNRADAEDIGSEAVIGAIRFGKSLSNPGGFGWRTGKWRARDAVAKQRDVPTENVERVDVEMSAEDVFCARVLADELRRIAHEEAGLSPSQLRAFDALLAAEGTFNDAVKLLTLSPDLNEGTIRTHLTRAIAKVEKEGRTAVIDLREDGGFNG